MNISTNLRIGIVAVILIAVCGVTGSFALNAKLRKAHDQQHLATEIFEIAYRISLLRQSYTLQPDPLVLKEILDAYDNQWTLLNEVPSMFNSEPEQTYASSIIESSKESRRLLTDLIEATERGASQKERLLIGSALSAVASKRIDALQRLLDTTSQREHFVQNLFTLIASLLMIAACAVAAWMNTMSGTLARSLSAITENAKHVAAGRYERVKDPSMSNEFKKYAEAFQEMASSVRSEQASLQKRIGERDETVQQVTSFLNAVIENLPDMIFMKDAKELRFVLMNKAGEELLGLKRDALIGKSDYDFFPKEQADFFIKKDRAVLESGTLLDIPEEQIQTTANGTRWLHTKKIPIIGADGKPAFLLGISEDITNDRQQRMALRQAYDLLQKETSDIKKFQKAVEASTDAIIITDAETIVLYVNGAWEQLTGYAAGEIVGKSANILKSSTTDPDILASLGRAIKTGKHFQSDEIINRRKDGSEYNVDLTIYPTSAEDGKYFVGVERDITNRKIADKMKTEFVSLASHQLRTPLTQIRWALSAIQRQDVLNENASAVLDEARRAAASMAETIHMMLTISRLESGRIRTNSSSVNVKDIITDAMFQHDHVRQRRKIRTEVSCDNELVINTDEILLKEIIANLLSNAYKYTAPEGLVSIGVRSSVRGTEISITDTGYGIPPQEQSRVKEKFFRGSNVVSLPESGTGLGLHLVYALAQILGAKVCFTSELGTGTTFTVLLPS